MTKRIFVLTIAVIACFARTGHAQTCLGAPSFRDVVAQGMAMQVAGRIGRLGDATTFGMDFGVGRSAFLILGYTGSTAENVGATAQATFGVDLGSDRIAVCPLGRFGRFLGTERAQFSSHGYWVEGGAQVGIVVLDTDLLRVVPTLGVRLDHERRTIDFVGLDRSPQRTSSTFGLARLGVGLVLSDNVGITPTLQLNLGEAGAKSFILQVALAFGA